MLLALEHRRVAEHLVDHGVVDLDDSAAHGRVNIAGGLHGLDDGAGLTGLAAGYGLEYWTQVIQWPQNIGGRPYHSWVAFIPPAYETTILFAALSCFGALLVLCGLPKPYHPVFNAPRFSLATSDRYFLVIKTSDPKFSADATKSFLSGLKATEVVSVDE